MRPGVTGRRVLPAFAMLWLLAAIPLRPAQATILLFDQQRDAVGQTTVGPTTSGGRLPADYGDNVTGPVMAVAGGFFTYGDGGEGFTPDVSLEIHGDGGPSDPRVSLWQNGYGDLVNVIFGEGPGTAGSSTLNVMFTATPGFAVDLYGFDLAGFGSDYTIAGVEVLAGAASLFSAGDVLVQGDLDGPGHTSVDFTTPLSAPQLLLRIDLSNLAAGIQDNVGLDSIRFGQTPPPVPEPGTTALLLCALVLLGRVGPKRARPRAAREFLLGFCGLRDQKAIVARFSGEISGSDHHRRDSGAAVANAARGGSGSGGAAV